MKRIPLAVCLLLLLTLVWLAEHTEPLAKSSDLVAAWQRAEAFSDERTQVEQQLLVRKERLQRFMIDDPAAALAMAIPQSEWDALPVDLKPFFEVPFSKTARWEVFPNCGDQNSSAGYGLLTFDGQSFETALHGRYRGSCSKNTIAATGFHLGSKAVLDSKILHLVEKAEKPVFQAGGRSWAFESQEAAAAAELALQAAEATPGWLEGSAEWLAALPKNGNFASQVTARSVALTRTWTETPKRMLVIPADFSNLPGDPVDLVQLKLTLETSVCEALEAMSYGKTSLSNVVMHPRVRLPLSSAGYLPSQNRLLHDDAQAAATAMGTNLGNYDVLVVVFANIGLSSGGVVYSGLATVGGNSLWLQEAAQAVTITHELGHHYGLGHASFWQPSTAELAGPGSSQEYGDSYDVMGSGSLPHGHFHPQGKRTLNWLPAADAPLVTTSGVRRLLAFDLPGAATGLRGLKLAKSGGDSYWLGFRAGTEEPTLKEGLALYWEMAQERRSWLLDATPGTSDKAGLVLGRTWSEPNSQLHVTPLAIGGTGNGRWMDVAVNLGAFPGNQTPGGSLTGPNTVTARQAVLYSADFFDPDGDALSYHWDFGDGVVYPDASRIARSWAVGGTTTLTLTVSDRKGASTIQTKNITVVDPGLTWTNAASATTIDLLSIASNGSVAVAVGGNNTQRHVIRSSTDGVTWVARSLPAATSTQVYAKAICWSGSQFVIVGQDYDFSAATWKGVVHTSPDGAVWTRRFFGGTPLYGVAAIAAGDAYVAVGDAGGVVTSTNGVTWVVRNAGVASRLSGVTWQQGFFHAVGHDYSTALNSYNGNTVSLRSADGITWTNLSTAVPLQNWRDLRAVMTMGNFLAASGFWSGLLTSQDAGASWQELNKDVELPAMAQGNGVWLAAGIDSSTGDDIDFVTTRAGVAVPWSSNSPGPVADRNAATFFKDRFITVADGGGIRYSGIISQPSGFSEWLATKFPTGQGSGHADDADADGFSNLMEYVAGTDPKAAASLPNLTTSVGSQVTISLATPLQRPTDIAVTGETSTDLLGWEPVGFSINADTPTVYTISLSPSAMSPYRRYLRLRLDAGAR